MEKFDVTIIGAGVIGLALAHVFASSKRFGSSRIALVEQEAAFGQHTSSRHSEVIHAGIYYPEGSLKARLCVRGKALLYEFCEKYEITYKRIGKLIISRSKYDSTLEELKDRAEINGVLDLQYWDSILLEKREPALRAATALYSPSTGIIDSHGYMDWLLRLARENGVIYATNTEITAIEAGSDSNLVLSKDAQSNEEYAFQSQICINAAGLGAQKLAEAVTGIDKACIPDLHPCKGDYFSYGGRNPFGHLIYPKPEPDTRGLGIHSTVDLAGQLRFGPDATFVDTLDYSVQADKRSLFAQSIREYFPQLEESRLQPAYAGIRPKLVGPGQAAGDFTILGPEVHKQEGIFHLFGIESPGLTSSLALAEYVLDLV